MAEFLVQIFATVMDAEEKKTFLRASLGVEFALCCLIKRRFTFHINFVLSKRDPRYIESRKRAEKFEDFDRNSSKTAS